MSRSYARPIVILASGVFALFGSAAAVSAHDFWTVPNAFAVAAGGSMEVRGQSSVRFPTSGSTVTPNRAGEARVIREQARGDSAAVAATVDRFHGAIVAGDSALAMSLLAPDAVVLESGGVETREEFRAHHLPADIAFAQAVKSERGPMRVLVRGDVAWASSTSTTTGDYRGRQVNSAGAELVVLARVGKEWKISAIHWSSRTRRAPGT